MAPRFYEIETEDMGAVDGDQQPIDFVAVSATAAHFLSENIAANLPNQNIPTGESVLRE